MIAFLDANFAVAIRGRSLVAGISATPITYCGRTPSRPTLPRNFVVDAVVAAEADSEFPLVFVRLGLFETALYTLLVGNVR